jgi:hypothetical protein
VEKIEWNNAYHFVLSPTSITSTSTYLAPGESSIFTVTPKNGLAVGTYGGSVNVSSWRASKGFSFVFTVNPPDGAPTYGISLSQWGTYAFPSAAEGYGPQARCFAAVTNTGNQPTGPLTAFLSGPGSGAFALSSTSIGSLPAGEYSTFTAAPQTGLAAGTYEAVVAVRGDNGIDKSFNVRFTVNPRSGDGGDGNDGGDSGNSGNSNGGGGGGGCDAGGWSLAVTVPPLAIWLQKRKRGAR